MFSDEGQSCWMFCCFNGTACVCVCVCENSLENFKWGIFIKSAKSTFLHKSTISDTSDNSNSNSKEWDKHDLLHTLRTLYEEWNPHNQVREGQRKIYACICRM